jgi:FkbM family methyltransferase
MLKYQIAKILCPLFPPLISQTIRSFFVRNEDGEQLSQSFKKRSITGGWFFGITSDFHAFKFSVHGYFEWRNIVIAHTVLKHKPGSIVEVGANIGTETISFCDIAKKFKQPVIAFEPLQENSYWIKKLKDYNGYDHLTLMECLVSDYVGKAGFIVPQGNNSGSGHIAEVSDERSETYDVVTLDSIVSASDTRIIFVDCEGFEYQILQGAIQTLKQQKPVLVLEVNSKLLERRGHVTLGTFYEFLDSLGYHCFYINRTGLELVDKNEFQKKQNKNWVCISKDDNNLPKFIQKSILMNSLNPFIKFTLV